MSLIGTMTMWTSRSGPASEAGGLVPSIEMRISTQLRYGIPKVPVDDATLT
jgi:hypothetical protein